MDTGKVKLVENVGWVEEAEDTIHDLTPDNWESKFKKAIWIGKLYRHPKVITYWDAYTKDPGDKYTLNNIKRFFQMDYLKFPKLIRKAIKSNN